MKKIVLISIVILVLVVGGFFIFRARSNASAQAILKVTSTPGASIFLNNENIGKTPYEDKVKPGEYTLKLVPESTVNTVASWESKVTLNPSLLTFVNRELKDSDLTSAGEILTLEKISGSAAEISVISTPDGATVTIDGSEKGKTPIVIRDLNPGNYELAVSAPGASARSIKVKTTAGYQLNAVFNLASNGLPQPSPSPVASPSDKEEASPTPSPRSRATPGASPRVSPRSSPRPSGSATTKASPPAKPYIEVLDTPTDFLNVRAEPSTGAEIVSRVNPGEFYALLDEETVANTPWYKIEYEDGKEGWVTSQYAKKTE